MARLKCRFSFVPIEQPGSVTVDGCNNFSFYNAGNVNVTINDVLVLIPGASWPNLEINPDMEIDDKFKIMFNVGTDITAPTFEAPVPGFNVADGSGTNPGGIFDTRLVLIKSHVTL